MSQHGTTRSPPGTTIRERGRRFGPTHTHTHHAHTLEHPQFHSPVDRASDRVRERGERAGGGERRCVDTYATLRGNPDLIACRRARAFRCHVRVHPCTPHASALVHVAALELADHRRGARVRERASERRYRARKGKRARGSTRAASQAWWNGSQSGAVRRHSPSQW